ncbi:MAG: TetR/AcrR family transcriptional regulator [Acidimicrobiia bacterium]
MREAANTRDKLLDAAARLFAERGIDNVSLAEIVRCAGQRNASALHYHFGSRDAVLVALLERHVPDIRLRRLELLEAARFRADDDARAAAEAIVRPITEFAQQGWRERAYLQYGSELGQQIERVAPEVQALLHETSGFEAWDLLRRRCPRLTKKIWLERMAICTAFIGRAAADRAALLDRAARSDRAAPHPVLSDDLFVDNLIDMLVGAMTAPLTVRSH